MSKTVGLVALEPETGKEIWRSPPIGDLAYVTPRPVTLCGVDQVVTISSTVYRNKSKQEALERGGAPFLDMKEVPQHFRFMSISNNVVGVSVNTGEVLWRYHGDWACANPIPAPTPVGDDRVFVTGGYFAGSIMLRIVEQDGVFSARLDHATRDLGSQIPHPILHRDHLYLVGNGNFMKHGLACMDLDGNVKWKTGPDSLLDRGHLVMADGLLLHLDGKEGLLRMIDPDPAGYRELARADAFKGAELWAPLVVAHGRLLVRSETELVCLDLRKTSAATP
jgi:outer membrane protein assembly factor BamB